jgi:hypothetical protein
MKAIFVIVVAFLLAMYDVVDALTACAVIKRHMDGENYAIRPIDCPEGETRFKASQIVKFVQKDQISSTNRSLKVGTRVFFRFDENKLSDAQRAHIIKYDRFKRGIPAVLAFFQTWYTTMVVGGFLTTGVYFGIIYGDRHDYTPEYVFRKPAQQLDKTYEKLIEKLDKERKLNPKNFTLASHAPNPLQDANGPHYVPPKNSGKAKNTNNRQNQKCASKTTASTSSGSSQSAKKGRLELPGGGGGGQGPPPPPTPPPKKSLSKIVIIDDDEVREEDAEDEDVVLISDDENVAPDAPVAQDELPNQVILRDDDDDVQIINDNEIHVNVDSQSTITIAECQASTSAAAAGRPPSTHTVISFASSTSDLSQGPSIPSLQLALPATRRNPGVLPRIVRPAVPENLQWAGNLWGVEATGITNTCNVDSFLSQVTYQARRHPGYFDVHLNLINSPAERAVWSLSHLANVRNPEARAHSISSHRTWLNFLAQERQRTNSNPFPLTRSGAVNMAGGEFENVMRPLADSSNLWFIHSCQCERDSADANPERSVYNAQDLHNINSNTYDTKKTQKKCKKCKSHFNSNQRPIVSAATWFHGFDAPQDANITAYPQTMTFHDISSGNDVHFDVGYFTFTRREIPLAPGQDVWVRPQRTQRLMQMDLPIGHQVSVHMINGAYQYYDGMQAHGDFQAIPENLKQFFRLERVVYFRRFGSI